MSEILSSSNKSASTPFITIFSPPRPFKGHFEVIQKNAILSWLRLGVQVILIDDEEETTYKVATELGIECIRNTERNEDNILFLDDVVRKVRQKAKGKVLAYVNADIILLHDFVDTIKNLELKNFYLAGQRWDVDIVDPIDFSQTNVEDELHRWTEKGELHPITGMDYLVFPSSWQFNMPRLLVGRPAFDNWFIQTALFEGIPVIDCTAKITCIHQNHKRGKALGHDKYAEEELYNRKLTKGSKFHENKRVYFFNLMDSTHRLDSSGKLIRIPYTFSRVIRYLDDLEAMPGPLFVWKLIFFPLHIFHRSFLFKCFRKSIMQVLKSSWQKESRADLYRDISR